VTYSAFALSSFQTAFAYRSQVWAGLLGDVITILAIIAVWISVYGGAQSVEGVKGLRSCDGGLPQFSVLSDESRDWPARDVGTSVTFTWVFTARHRTADWEYFIGDTRLETVDGGNEQPEAVVSHEVDLSWFSGRQTVLAVWNIGDTPFAF
jgi:predicted carbohydrate-binding protein with CBM5 and CBM33 domain